MKTNFKLFALSLISVIFSSHPSVFAEGGNSGGGGEPLANQYTQIADFIVSEIESGELKSLGVSAVVLRANLVQISNSLEGHSPLVVFVPGDEQHQDPKTVDCFGVPKPGCFKNGRIEIARDWWSSPNTKSAEKLEMTAIELLMFSSIQGRYPIAQEILNVIGDRLLVTTDGRIVTSPREIMNCEPSSVEIERLKIEADAALKVKNESKSQQLVINQETSRSKVMNPQSLAAYILDEFNNDTILRLQAIETIVELEGNGRNASSQRSIYKPGIGYCSRQVAIPSDIKVVRVKGNPFKTQTLQARISFNDGYHGGFNTMTLVYEFETQATYWAEPKSPKFIPRWSMYVTQYPKLIKVESVSTRYPTRDIN